MTRRTFLGVVNQGLTALAGVALLVMVLMIVLDISGRVLFNQPIAGTLEMVRTLLVVVVFGGVAYAQAEKIHVRVSVLLDRARGRARLAGELLAVGLGLLVMGAIAYGATREGIRATLMGEATMGLVSFPMWPSRLALAAGLIILSLQYAADFIHFIRTQR